MTARRRPATIAGMELEIFTADELQRMELARLGLAIVDAMYGIDDELRELERRGLCLCTWPQYAQLADRLLRLQLAADLVDAALTWSRLHLRGRAGKLRALVLR